MKPRGLASRFFCARTATADLSKVPDFRTSNCVGSGCRRWRLGLLRAVRCRTNPNSLMGRIDPFATSSQNDCNLGTGDGRSRRLADTRAATANVAGGMASDRRPARPEGQGSARSGCSQLSDGGTGTRNFFALRIPTRAVSRGSHQRRPAARTTDLRAWRFVYLAFLTGEAFHFDWSEDWAITASK
jgi:hypothetical protein